MKRYLFTWECGAGLGHLSPYQQLIELLLERGHEVMFASRDLGNAERVYGHLPVKLVQAPIHQRRPEEMILPRSYADVLFNQGFDHPSKLKPRVENWLQLLESWQPSVIVADHSPTVLLAQRIYERAPCIVAGNGFCVPPVSHPFPPFPPTDQQPPPSSEALVEREHALLRSVVNPVLHGWGQSMERCQQLFSPHPQWLFGLPRLDHYPGQRAQHFLGNYPSMGGEPASWPDAPGPRAFIYAKAHPIMPEVVRALAERQWPTLIYAPEWPDEWKRQVHGPTMKLSAKPLDLQSIAERCNLAVNNGGPGAVTELLLEGVPQLCAPLHIEQWMFSRALQATGACLVHTPNEQDAPKIGPALDSLANLEGRLKRAAMGFAKNQDNRIIADPLDLLNQLESIG